MTSKLTWTTAVILIVAAVAVGSWAILGTPAAQGPPTTGEWTLVQDVAAGQAYGIWTGESSGIAKVHLMFFPSNFKSTENLSGYWMQVDNRLATLSATAQTIDNFPYDNRFAIVVETQVDDNEMGQMSTAYMKVSIDLSYDSGWNPAAENSTDNMENVFATGSNTRGINVVWDNGGNGYVLRADDNLNIADVSLWCRG